MSTVAVFNAQGAEVRKMDLNPIVFDAPINTNCVRAAVNCQLARRRQGTAATKTRGLVSGTNAKPWRQKGTGRARAGEIRSPLWRHGGTVFGPQPGRTYGGRINHKVARSAILSCLTSIAQDKELVVVDRIEIAQPKTREALELLKKLGIEPKRILFLTETTNINLALSVRNIPYADIINCDNLNSLDLTTHDVVIATSAAIERLQEVYGHEA